MANAAELQAFLSDILGREDLEISPRAVARLRGFQFDWLDDIPPEDRLLVVTAFQAGLTGHDPLSFRRLAGSGADHAPRRVSADDVASGIAALARMISNRGLEYFAPETQQMILGCDCWPDAHTPD